MKTFAVSVAITLAVTAAIAFGTRVISGRHPAARVIAMPSATSNVPPRQVRYIGEVGLSPTRWAALTSVPANIVTTYNGWVSFDLKHAKQIHKSGALPLFFFDSGRLPLREITDGSQDAFLTAYGRAVAAFGHSVTLSFDPEENGGWYRWGCRRSTPAAYIAAWRHVHKVITNAGARNVIWMWDVNRTFRSACPLRTRWPGASYVNWIGIDGYWRHPGDTFASALAPTIDQVKALTDKPILIAETGVPNVPQAPAWLRGLFVGVETTPGVIGFVYSNYANHHGDYKLEDDPAAKAVFRVEAKSLMK